MNHEEIAKALDALGVTVTYAIDPVDGSRIEVVSLDDLVRIGAVFEQANTPTDDERPDLIGAASAAFRARGGAPDWEEDAIARDLIFRWHLRGFEDGEKFGRRTVQGEPTEYEKSLPVEVIEAMDRAEASVERGEVVRGKRRVEPTEYLDHYTDPNDPFWQSRPEPVTRNEPTDAQVVAALNAYQDRRRLGTTLGDWGSVKVQRMRAALRAAMSFEN